MKLFGIKALALAVLTVALGSCGLVPSVGSVPQPYSVEIRAVVDEKGVIKVTALGITSLPGAYDIQNVTFTSTLVNPSGNDVTEVGSSKGFVYSYAKGGYKCTPQNGESPDLTDAKCTINSPAVYFVANQTPFTNAAGNTQLGVVIPAIPLQWISYAARQPISSGFTIRYTYSGRTLAGNDVTWVQIEQLPGY